MSSIILLSSIKCIDQNDVNFYNTVVVKQKDPSFDNFSNSLYVKRPQCDWQTDPISRDNEKKRKEKQQLISPRKRNEILERPENVRRCRCKHLNSKQEKKEENFASKEIEFA